MPRGCYTLGSDLAKNKSAGGEPMAKGSVVFSMKEIRQVNNALAGSSRRSANPCHCENRKALSRNKVGSTDCVCLHPSRMRSQKYKLNLGVRARNEDKPNHILIVDDDETMREIFRDYLRRLGYTVVEAENGCAGVEAAVRERPRLILMNYLMPEMDGLTATEIIRQQPSLKKIPIIMSSACMEEEMKEVALSAGCVEYIEQPASPRELQDKIEAYSPLRK
ncbi:MAG: response regulator receiver [Acidobacteria bacterium]|nr:response regulator receiver [Acidobacteriota bacterium]